MARRGMKTADPEQLASKLGKKKLSFKRGADDAETGDFDVPAGDIEDIEDVTGKIGPRSED